MQSVAAFVVLLGMLALNVAIFGGRGYIVALGPVVWLFVSANRWRILSERLRSQDRR